MSLALGNSVATSSVLQGFATHTGAPRTCSERKKALLLFEGGHCHCGPSQDAAAEEVFPGVPPSGIPTASPPTSPPACTAPPPTDEDGKPPDVDRHDGAVKCATQGVDAFFKRPKLQQDFHENHEDSEKNHEDSEDSGVDLGPSEVLWREEVPCKEVKIFLQELSKLWSLDWEENLEHPCPCSKCSIPERQAALLEEEICYFGDAHVERKPCWGKDEVFAIQNLANHSRDDANPVPSIWEHLSSLIMLSKKLSSN